MCQIFRAFCSSLTNSENGVSAAFSDATIVVGRVGNVPPFLNAARIRLRMRFRVTARAAFFRGTTIMNGVLVPCGAARIRKSGEVPLILPRREAATPLPPPPAQHRTPIRGS